MINVLLATLFALSPGDLVDVEAVLLDGRVVRGGLRELSAERVTIHREQGGETLAIEQLLRLTCRQGDSALPLEGPAADPSAQVVVELVDGSRLPGRGFTMVDRQATWQPTATAQPLEVAADQLQAVVWNPLSPAAARLWSEASQKQLAGDVLVVNKRNRESADYVAGVVGDIRDDRLEFTWDGETISVNSAKVAAVRLYRPLSGQLPPSRARLVLRDGSEIYAAAVELDQQRLNIETPAGVRLSVAAASLAMADFSLGKQAYLSDLEPLLFQWTPLVGLPSGLRIADRFGEYRRDESLSGSAITLRMGKVDQQRRNDVRTFTKGVALRSRSEIVYRVPPRMQRFQSLVGIDPQTARDGHVWVELFGDDRLLWQGAVSGIDAPETLDLDLTGVDRFRLVIDYGENLDFGDRVHFANARFSK